MLEVIKDVDADRVLVSVALTRREVSFMRGAVGSHMLRLEDLLHRGAVRSKSDTRTDAELGAELRSLAWVMHTLTKAADLFDYE